MPETPASPPAAPLLEALAARIARRDLPPDAADPRRFEPDHIRQRLDAALAALVPDANSRGRAALVHMCYAYVAAEALTAAQLAGAAGLGRLAGSRAHRRLLAVGLLRGGFEGGLRHYRLSRWGEDWLLALGRCEVPPPRPA